MTPTKFKLDGSPCQGFRFGPANSSPRAVLHIVHGMSEHSLRYSELAKVLTQRGWIVYAHDHRGHGQSIGTNDEPGHFADKDGWSLAIQDLAAFLRYDRKQHPDLPLVVFGQSMGSFLVQDYVTGNAAEGLSAAILSGTNGRPPLIAQIGLWLARFECLRQGLRGRSPLLSQLSFMSFNQKFKPNRTTADWLSRDVQEVDAYVEDPLCGFQVTNQLWVDLLQALPELTHPQRLAQIPKNFPIYIFGGDKDPTNDQGRGLVKLVEALRSAGLQQIDFKLYADGRHEMLHEVNRNHVTTDLIEWLENQVLQPS